MDFLLCVLPVGKENAIHQADLGQKLGITPAAAKRMVRKARQAGKEVLSGSEGYWLPQDNTERMAFKRLMQKQAISRFISIKPTRNALNEISGQMDLTNIDYVAEGGDSSK